MIAIVSLTELTLVAPAVVAAAIAYSAGRARGAQKLDSLDRELMRRRRREEPAALLLVEGRCDTLAETALRDCLRVTDTVDCRIRRGRVRIRALLDMDRLDRDAVERRLAATGEVELSVGWATFPEDGLTLATVLDAAYDRLVPVARPATTVFDETVPHTPRPAEQTAS